MGSGWVPIYLLPVPYPCFEIEENPNPYSNLVKTGKTRQIEFGSGVTTDMGFVVMPTLEVPSRGQEKSHFFRFL